MKKRKICALLLGALLAATLFACGDKKKETSSESAHNYVNGVCTNCGAEEPKNESSETLEALESSATSKVSEESESSETSESSAMKETSESSEFSETVQSSESSETSEILESSKTSASSEESESSETSESSENSETSEVSVSSESSCSHTYVDGACSSCGEVCEHEYTHGTCSVCGAVCAHTYVDSVCSVCGTACVSHEYEDGVCTVCKKPCAPHEYEDGVCSVCGVVCEHNYKESVCTVCGVVCTHSYEDGVCKDCGLVCEEHTYENGVCTNCGAECAHVYEKGTCTVCGAEDLTYVPADGDASKYQKILAKYKELALYYETNGKLPSKATNAESYVDTLYAVFEGYDTSTELGYAIRDINGDGYVELFLLGKDFKVYALFTLVKRAPVAVSAFTRENNCSFTEDGTVFFYEKAYDANSEQIGVAYKVTKLIGAELVGFEYGWADADGDGSNSDDRTYYEKENGVKKTITNDEYKVYTNHVYEYYLSYSSRLAKYTNTIIHPIIGATSGATATADFSSYEAIKTTLSLMHSDVASRKMDRTKWLSGEYDDGMIFKTDADFVTYNRLFAAIVTLQGSSSSSDYGYAEKDLNGDGVKELILMDQYGSGTSKRQDVFAIFTLVNGKPVLLDVYNDLRYASIDSNGYIYVAERVLLSHKKDMVFTVYEVKNGTLSPVSSYGYHCDYATSSTQIAWYKVVGGVKTAVEKTEFDEFYNAKIKTIATSISVANFGKYNAKSAGLSFTTVVVEEE